MAQKILERIQIDEAVAPQAAGASGKTSSWFDMADYRRVAAVGQFGSTTATEAKLTLMQATSSAGAGAKTLSTASVTTDATTAESAKLTAEAQVSDLDLANDYRYVQVKVEYGTSDDVSAVLIRGDGRYDPQNA